MSAEHGRQLRERLQPVRPAVPRLRAGRGRLPPQARGHRRHLRAQPHHQHDDPALHARDHHLEGGTEITTRFNLFRSVEINGVPGRGYTSGQALAALEDVFKETMPKEMGFAYSSLSYQEKIAPPAGPTLVLAIVFVFLLLAAMYESWRLPWAVLLGSPLVALGAFFGVWLDGLRQQRLRPGRPHHADRPRRQERDPDRRVRQGEARGRHVGSRRPRWSRRGCASGRS